MCYLWVVEDNKSIRFHNEKHNAQLISVGRDLGRLLARSEVIDIFAAHDARLRSTFTVLEYYVIPPLDKDQQRQIGKAIEDLANSLDSTPPPARYKE